ncbi:hypothetical protein J6590_047579, partial [Homalodisca vitripennis]
MRSQDESVKDFDPAVMDEGYKIDDVSVRTSLTLSQLQEYNAADPTSTDNLAGNSSSVQTAYISSEAL